MNNPNPFETLWKKLNSVTIEESKEIAKRYRVCQEAEGMQTLSELEKKDELLRDPVQLHELQHRCTAYLVEDVSAEVRLAIYLRIPQAIVTVEDASTNEVVDAAIIGKSRLVAFKDLTKNRIPLERVGEEVTRMLKDAVIECYGTVDALPPALRGKVRGEVGERRTLILSVEAPEDQPIYCELTIFIRER